MVIFTARLKAMPGKEEEAAEQLKAMVKSVKKHEPGAVAFIGHTSPSHPGEFLFYEVYADETARADHRKTPHYEKLKALFGDILDPVFGVQFETLEQVAGFYRD